MSDSMKIMYSVYCALELFSWHYCGSFLVAFKFVVQTVY